MAKSENAVYFTHQIRHCEQKAILELGLTEDELMMRAGIFAFSTLKNAYCTVQNIAVFCGNGNNAGDAYVVARLAHQNGMSVIVYHFKPMEDLPSAARHAAVKAIAAGVTCHCLDDFIDSDAELIVDGLLGLGVRGEVEAPMAYAINLINDSGLPVLSLDLPSGLDADTGRVLGVCVNADITTTFIALKMGMLTLDGPDQCGQIICHSLQLEECIACIPTDVYRLDEQLLVQTMTPRRRNSHKGMHGHVLAIGGGMGMPGAISLAAQAALRTGAGMVTIATRDEYSHTTLPHVPEAMIQGIKSASELLPLLAKASVCVIGPGLGEDEWAKALFTAAIAAQLPLVIDASALRMLANYPQHDDNWILTPHPGEAASLLLCSTAEVQANRFNAAQLIQQQYGGSVILKGTGTIICTGQQQTSICTQGNPGMASAGMGDVLSGIIGGLLAQGVTIADAAKLGVWLHANAADDAVELEGERGLLASDLMPFIRHRINGIK